MACGYCLSCADAAPRKYQLSASLGSISVTRRNASTDPWRIVGILVQQAQAEPGVGIVGIVLAGGFEKRLCGIDAGQVQQRDALIQSRDLQFGIEGGSLLKGLETFLEKLLVHVGRAQIVQACRFGGAIGLRRRAARSGGENRGRSQSNAGAEQEASLSHARNK